MAPMYLRLEGSDARMIIDPEYNSPEEESNKNPTRESNNRLTVWRCRKQPLLNGLGSD
jgi:hypothetical protein